MKSKHTSPSLVRRTAIGAAAGVAATFALQGLMRLSSKVAPEAQPPMKADPAEFMISQVESFLNAEQRSRIVPEMRADALKALHLGYGATFGALYGAYRPLSGSVIIEGALLGLLTWATGYLGWLPATGLMPPIHKQSASQVALPIAQHAIFGIAVAGLHSTVTRLATD